MEIDTYLKQLRSYSLSVVVFPMNTFSGACYSISYAILSASLIDNDSNYEYILDNCERVSGLQAEDPEFEYRIRFKDLSFLR